MGFLDFLFISRGERKIMATLAEVTQKLDDLTANVKVIDATVEALFEQIKQLTGDGITPEAATALTEKIAEVQTALDAVTTDD